MRCIIIATGYRAELEPLIQHRPSVLFKVVNKPILFHVLDFLSKHKIKECNLLLNHLPQQIEDAVMEGDAWGIKISYHLVKDSDQPFKMIGNIVNSWGKDPVLLGLGDQLPLLESLEGKSNTSTLFQFPSKEWSGWGIIPADHLADLNTRTKLKDLPESIKPFYLVAKAQYHISTKTFKDYINSNLRPLSHKISGFGYPTTAHEIQKGVWISRSVAIHHNVKIEQPVFIGENCQIMNNVEIGPNVIIENDCIIDKDSVIKHSMILKKSYVGENLDLHDSIVDRNLLINFTHETALRIHDDFIISEINPPPLFRYPLRWIVKSIAACTFLLLLPIYYYLRRTCQLQETQMLQLPTSTDVNEWKTFPYRIFIPKEGKSMSAFQNCFKKLPLLPAVISGHIHVVGSGPRTPEETNQLPEDWKKLYLKSKVGLINLATLDQGEAVSQDDIYAAEAYYAIQMSFWMDVKLILRWIKGHFFWWIS